MDAYSLYRHYAGYPLPTVSVLQDHERCFLNSKSICDDDTDDV